MPSMPGTGRRSINVRFTPESRHVRRNRSCPLWAKSGLMRCSKTPSLDHPVSDARARSVSRCAQVAAMANRLPLREILLEKEPRLAEELMAVLFHQHKVRGFANL